MTLSTLEQRVERLERMMEEMRGRTLREPSRDDWQTTIGMFANDPIAKEIMDEALRIREEERQREAP